MFCPESWPMLLESKANREKKISCDDTQNRTCGKFFSEYLKVVTQLFCLEGEDLPALAVRGQQRAGAAEAAQRNQEKVRCCSECQKEIFEVHDEMIV